ncbi:MAG: hypothetical protein ACREP0_10340 [Rhodanobacteraceae bacterium]
MMAPAEAEPAAHALSLAAARVRVIVLPGDRAHVNPGKRVRVEPFAGP